MKYLIFALLLASCSKSLSPGPTIGSLRIRNETPDPILIISSPDSIFRVDVLPGAVTTIWVPVKAQWLRVTSIDVAADTLISSSYQVTVADFNPDSVIQISMP